MQLAYIGNMDHERSLMYMTVNFPEKGVKSLNKNMV